MSGREPLRTFRMSEAEWVEVRRIAAERGESVSEVVRAALRRYIKRHR